MIRGKTLGGTSSINYLSYVRGSPHDFNSWEDSGAVGWGWSNVEPYFRKVENATMDGMSAKLGRNGNLKLSRNHNEPSKAWTLIKNAASELGKIMTSSESIIEHVSGHNDRFVIMLLDTLVDITIVLLLCCSCSLTQNGKPSGNLEKNAFLFDQFFQNFNWSRMEFFSRRLLLLFISNISVSSVGLGVILQSL